MKRDTVKTLIGLLIIGIIVVATFLYGNAQRQAQLRHDQDVKKQQEAAAGNQTAKTTPEASKSTASPVSNTAPVKTPASNSIQGGQVAGAQVTPGDRAGSG